MTESQARDTASASLPGPIGSVGAWQGDGLYARSSQFGLILLAPIGAGILGQGSRWLPYAILTRLLGFAADTGGPPVRRLTGFLIAGVCRSGWRDARNGSSSDVVLTALAPGVVAVLYGPVGGNHASYATSARIMCLGTVIAAFFTPVEPFDIAVIAAFALYSWLVSIGLGLGDRVSASVHGTEPSGAGVRPPRLSTVALVSIDPELMVRMLIAGYCFGIRSERRLCEEVHLNLAYRWFCRLGLDGDVPDHSPFSKNRHGRFRESNLLRKLFETVVGRCMKEGIVGGEAFAVDASIIVADAHRRRGVAKIDDLDPTSNRAVTEYLSVLDDAAFGGATSVEPKTISPTDPAARYTASANSVAGYAYSDNYLIDLKHAVIMDVEATTAIRQAEVGAAKTMLDRTFEQFDLTPLRLVGDGGYGSAEMVGWLVDEGEIEPHVNLIDKSERTDGTFSRSDFTFDTERDLYACPGGKELRKRRRAFSTSRESVAKDGTIRYRAAQHDCDACMLKPKCCPNMLARKIARSVHEAARDKARAIAKTEAYAVSCRKRKKVEMLFAHLKRILRLGRLRLRGPNGAKDEFLLAATAQNLWKLASSSLIRRRSSPHEAKRLTCAF